MTFHRVLPQALRGQTALPGLAVTPEELDWLLGFFTRNYACDTLAAQAGAFSTGVPARKPRLAITFDDGQWDNYGYAREILARHRVRASFYIPVAAVESGELLWHDRLGLAVRWLLEHDRRAELAELRSMLGGLNDTDDGALGVARVVAAAKRLAREAREQLTQRAESLAAPRELPEWTRLMSWEQIKTLAGDGHEIGSHSMTHALLPQCESSALRYEIAESRSVLRERTGADVVSFCYPDGAYDSRCVEQLKLAGYSWAVTTRWGANPRGSDVFELRRCDIHPDHIRSRDGVTSEARLCWRLSGLQPGL